MKTLPITFEKKGWHFQQIARDGDLAIYRRFKNPENPHFEVIRIRKGKDFEVAGRKVEAAEFYPSSEQWGDMGWTYSGENAREQAFQKLVSLQLRQRSARFDASEDRSSGDE